MFTNSGITAAYIGSTGVTKLYLGSTLIWPTGKDYSKEYFTMEFVSGGTISLVPKGSATNISLDYSKNDGGWTTVNSFSSTTINVSAGDIMKWRGTNTAFGVSENNYNHFSGSSYFIVYGNTMSLTKGDLFKNAQLTNNLELTGVLYGSNVIDAENLIFPSGTIPQRALDQYFKDCTKLVKSPKSLPASTLNDNACTHMFQNCSVMETTPLIYVTSIATGSMNGMFENCSAITSFEFADYLSSLGNRYALYYCFGNCRKLSYFKIKLAPNITSVGWTSWHNSISSTGTFVTNNVSAWPSGNNGIPSGWTVVEEQ